MNLAILFSIGLGLSYLLNREKDNSIKPIIKSPNKIDLGNNLFGYPRIQIEDRNQKAPLIIVLHGRGSDETGLQKIIPKDIPARVIFLRGQIDGKPGRYFFNARLAGPKEDLKNDLEEAGVILDEAIKKLTQIYPTSKVILFGFSQGAALSLYMGALGSANDIIAFSGSLSDNIYPISSHNTNIYMWHGTKDKIVPYELGKETADAFENAGYDTIFVSGQGKDHILPPKNIVSNFFKEVLK
jgi:predicted esterase